MSDNILVFGHKSPDTDSICSAISYAALKTKLGFNAKPKRLGNISPETKFILDYFKMPLPELLETVKPQAKDLDIYDTPVVSSKEPIKKAWQIMKERTVPVLPVVDEETKLVGIISISDITDAYMELSHDYVLATHNTPFSNLVEVLDSTPVIGGYKAEAVTGRAFMDSSISPEITLSEGDLVICGNNVDLQMKAVQSGAGCVIITGEALVEEAVIEASKETGCVILKTDHTFFRTIKLLNQALPIASIMKTKDLVFFYDTDYVDEIKETLKESKYRHFPILDKEGRVKGTISRRQLIDFKRKQVILMDHNERSQTVNGIDEAHILEVIDHHRIADFQTAGQVYFRSEPVGCTCTIVAKMYRENNITPEPEIAGLLASAIISDTLLFKSPTCTPIDKEMCLYMAGIAGVDVEKYGMEMLIAGTSLEGKTEKDIYFTDQKAFSLGKYKASVAQINTADLKSLYNKKEALLQLMNDLADEKGYDFCMLMMTDILIQGTELLTAGPNKELLTGAFGISVDEDSIFLPGVVSRKKQIIPQLMNAANN